MLLAPDPLCFWSFTKIAFVFAYTHDNSSCWSLTLASIVVTYFITNILHI